jgi:iron complex transport system substrate-binding protein
LKIILVTKNQYERKRKEDNRMKKQIKVLILGLVLMIAMTGCTSSKNEEAVSSQTPITTEAFSVVDMTGKEISFEKQPEKIAVLLASDVEILYALKAENSIVAVGEYCNYPSEALEKKVVTTGDDMNIEQVVALQADVVVMGTMAQTTEQIQQLEEAGMKVVVTDSKNIEDTYEAIDLLAQIAGKRDEGAALIEEMKAEFQAIKDQVPQKSEKTIYFEVSPLEYGLWTTGTGTFMQELVDMIGVKNIFDDVTGWAEVSEEQVLERNPEYIVTISMYSKDEMTPVEEILSRKNWAEVEAIKNKKVLADETDMFTRPGPRLVEAAKLLYGFAYQEELE